MKKIYLILILLFNVTLLFTYPTYVYVNDIGIPLVIQIVSSNEIEVEYNKNITLKMIFKKESQNNEERIYKDMNSSNVLKFIKNNNKIIYNNDEFINIGSTDGLYYPNFNIDSIY